MRIIDESLIPVGDAAYFKQGTWTHLQKAYKEAIDALAQAVIKDYDNTKVYILYGCVATGTDPGARTFSAGAVYYAGEVYLVPAASFTTTGADVAVANITEAFNTTDYSVDPQTTPNGNTLNLHVIRTIVLSAGAVGSGDVPRFNLWLNNGNAHANEYTDISSTVSVDSSITVVNKDVRQYADGTVMVSITGTISGNISVRDLVSGLPGASFYGSKDVVIRQYGTTIPNIRNKGLFSNAGVVSNEETIIIGTDSNISIVFEYKIA
jgi:hypothetical protein